MLKYFWNCGDNQIIEFAILRARLNSKESMILRMTYDECKTQEQIAEEIDVSVRSVQMYFKSAQSKMLKIPWVMAYAEYIKKEDR